jgi:hypothetical protein
MSSNTKARSLELQALAAEIAVREGIDVTNPPKDARAYITAIAVVGNCHPETARSTWAKHMRRARGVLVAQWGGVREGSGLKPGQSPAVNQKRKLETGDCKNETE